MMRIAYAQFPDAQVNEAVKISGLGRADVIRQALRIGLPQFVSRFQPAPLWLEERTREALRKEIGFQLEWL